VGSSLMIYNEGNASLSGNGIVNTNGSVNPLAVQYYGTTSSTAFNISGNGSFSGVVYAPQAQVTLSGNGAFYGAVVADAVTISGNGGFHYDVNLQTNGPSQGRRLLWMRRL
ncbi:MAG: DUF7305 domain-containing protein, partial [Candidatus Omnitrophota bacterium]